MNDIYKRLGRHGFDRAFILGHILPDWWDDDLADVPTNRAVAEGAIARMLGFSLRELSDPRQELSFPTLVGLKLKKAKKAADASQLKSTILLAEQAAKFLVQCLDLPRFTGVMSVRQARAAILGRRAFVDLDALLDFAWSSGIAVLHMSSIPPKLRKFAGLAMFAGNAPVIVLGSQRDASPWLAFHLAHELGHILLGHVAVGSAVLADVDLDAVDDDEEEKAADQFGCELLLGIPEPKATAKYGLTGFKLAVAAQKDSGHYKADPGVIALMYGRNAGRIPTAQVALKALGLDTGAKAKIAQRLKQHLRPDLPEVVERFAGLFAPPT